VPHEVAAFRWREPGQRRGDEVAHVVKGARPRGAQEGFQFGESLFDRIEIGTIRRQETQLRAHGFDRVPDGWLFVEGEIVEHDDVAAPERRHEHLLDVGQEGGIVERSVEDGGGRQAVGPQGGDDRVELPLPARREIPEAIPAGTAAIAAEQIGRDATLIEKEVAARVPERLPELPAAPRGRDIRTALFVGVYRFF
jgi:hypothetical protein